MKLKHLLQIVSFFITVNLLRGQVRDTVYIGTYPQKLRIMGNVSTSFIQVDDGTTSYTPNYPLNTGIGFAIKNTVFAIDAGYGFIPLKSKDEYGRSKMLDFQLHNYGRKTIFDIFLQKYQGFYSEKKIGRVEDIFEDMSVTQIGAEGTYVFNGKRFSSKAAFDLNEIQYRSVGSWLLGGGAFYYKVKDLGDGGNLTRSNSFENIQLGLNGGYAYSWVLSDRWMLTAMAKGGANFGNAPRELKRGKIEVYPTAYARFAGNYHKNDWGVSMSVMVSNKSLYPVRDNELSLTTVTMQLSYVKHLDRLFRKKH